MNEYELDLRRPPTATNDRFVFDENHNGVKVKGNYCEYGKLRWWIQTTKTLVSEPGAATDFECQWLVIMDNTKTGERAQATGRDVSTLLNIASRKLGEPLDPEDYQYRQFKQLERGKPQGE